MLIMTRVNLSNSNIIVIVNFETELIIKAVVILVFFLIIVIKYDNLGAAIYL